MDNTESKDSEVETDKEKEKDKDQIKNNETIFNSTDEWNSDDDLILKEWVDKSSCLKWLHERSYKKYKKQYLRQMIPVIVISTLTGVANFSINELPEKYKKYASLIIGGFNILGAMISTVSQFLKTSELKESHYIASKSWDKFSRTIKLELQRNPLERSSKKDIYMYSIKEYDRLVEISPDIPSSVIKKFRSEYKNIKDLIKPDIADKILSSKIYEQKEDTNKLVETIVIKCDDEIDEKEVLKNNYINKFINKYKRQPTNREIQEFIEMNSLSTNA